MRLLAEDARFIMPPLPAWFHGRDEWLAVPGEQVFATPWRLVPTRANGQLAFACYQGGRLRAVLDTVLTLRDGRIAELTGFLDPRCWRKSPPDR